MASSTYEYSFQKTVILVLRVLQYHNSVLVACVDPLPIAILYVGVLEFVCTHLPKYMELYAKCTRNLVQGMTKKLMRSLPFTTILVFTYLV